MKMLLLDLAIKFLLNSILHQIWRRKLNKKVVKKLLALLLVGKRINKRINLDEIVTIAFESITLPPLPQLNIVSMNNKFTRKSDDNSFICIPPKAPSNLRIILKWGKIMLKNSLA